MGIEGEIEETTEEPAEEKTMKKPERKIRVKKTGKFEVKTLKIEKEPEMETAGKIEERIEIKELSPAEESKPAFAEATAGKKTTADKEKWLGLNGEPEGQLAIDVYQTENDLVIQSAIAGVKPEILDISMEKDVINIKGSRQRPFEEIPSFD